MDSRDWILKNVNLTKEDLFAKRRKDKATSNKRWVVMCFFRAMGKSYPAIAKITKHDQSSCRHGCTAADYNIKNVAEELFCRYVTEVLHEPKPEPNFLQPPEPKKVRVKVPDYHANMTYFVEIPEDEIKKPEKIRSWDL